MSRRLHWYRHDLRTHDAPALHVPGPDGLSSAGGVNGPVPLERAELSHLLPVYVLSPRLAGRTSFGFSKLGPYRTRFLRETLEDLQQALRARGSELILAYGEPGEVIGELCRSYAIDQVTYQFEVGSEEAEEEHAVTQAVAAYSAACTILSVEGQTMYAQERTPFRSDFSDMPDTYTEVRKILEKSGTVPDPVPTPGSLPPMPKREYEPYRLRLFDDPSELFQEAGINEAEPDPRGAYFPSGGETAAFERIEHYFWETDALARYKYTRNGLIGPDYSSKLSAWLANGSLSPRTVHGEVRRYERERRKNVSTYWLVFELTWRDYFNFLTRKYPRDVFRLHGPMRRTIEWTQNRELFDRWRAGRTGEAFIDANMTEIALTGYMSNRGRQNVASYLARYLGVDWRMGAQWFESLLVDYDPASNYGNWTYNTGVGTDPRRDRSFDPARQAAKYDPQGEYRHLWLSR